MKCKECGGIIWFPFQEWIWGVDFCRVHTGKCYNQHISKYGAYWLGDLKEQEEWFKLFKDKLYKETAI